MLIFCVRGVVETYLRENIIVAMDQMDLSIFVANGKEMGTPWKN